MRITFLIFSIVFVSHSLIAQYGFLDDTFGNNGKVTWNYSMGFENASDILIQDDGKLIVIGSATESNTKIMVARFHPDGTVDNTFGENNGITLVEIVQGLNYGIKGAFQSDGKIIVGSRVGDGVYNDFACIRFTENGIVDNSFATDGIFTISLGTSTEDLNDVVVLSDDKILLAGTAADTDVNENFAIVKLSAEGILDPTFGNNGVLIHDVTGKFDRIKALTILSNGDIIGAGTIWDETRVLVSSLVKIKADGKIDDTFGTNGVISISPGPAASFFNDISLLNGGKILAAGVLDYDSQYDFMVARFNADGSLDTQFADGGIYSTYDDEISNYVASMQIQSDDKCILIGSEGTWPESDFALLRLNPDGTTDNTFGTNGYVVTDFFSKYDYATGSVLQADGKVIACGSAEDNGDYNLAMARYITGVGVGFREINEEVVFLNAFPNPTTSNITISFKTEKNTNVTLELFDVSGRIVSTLVPQRNYLAGQHTIVSNITNVKRGIYIMQIKSDNNLKLLMINKL